MIFGYQGCIRLEAVLFCTIKTGAGYKCLNLKKNGEVKMKSRVAVISIILEDVSSVEKLNAILSKYRERIIGRMGLPYREKNVNIICVAIDAPEDEINSMTGQIGRLKGVSAKTNYSNVMSETEE